jgi:ferric-dicitrate binding protein FerR (iron transport regulator)
MKHDDAWEGWLNRRREHAPPAGLTDRIIANVEQSCAASLPAAHAVPQPIPLSHRMAPYLLWSAAVIVCAARVYGTVGLLVPNFAFAVEPAEQGTSHVELAASGL